MIDLYSQQYDRETLKKHIYSVNLIDILKTQKIDAQFAVRYILQSKYQLKPEEELINVEMVLQYQPHINECDLKKELFLYDSDDDSIHFSEQE